MKMLIGVHAQGKLSLSRARTGFAIEEICNGESCPLDAVPCQPVVYRLHLLIRRLLIAGSDPLEWAERLFAENPDALIVTDEVGYGIVPADPFERAWREAVGRVCCLLAQRSERVERVVAGIPQLIKGEQ